MKLKTIALLALVMLTASSCDKIMDLFGKGDKIQTQDLSGQVDLGALAGNLDIITPVGMQSVANNANLNIKGLKSDNFQALFARAQSNGKALAIGLFDPVQKRMVVNDTSTVVSLSMFHPYMIFADYDQRKQYIEEVKKHPMFPELLSKYNDNLMNNPDKIFEITENSEFFQKMSGMMKGTFETMGEKNMIGGDRPVTPKMPALEDAPGGKIKFLNGNNIFYGGGLYDKNGAIQKSFSIGGEDKPMVAKLGWPPQIQTATKETEFDMGDGNFDVVMSKGFDFNKMADPHDPVGKGTAMNIAKCMVNVMEIMMGYQAKPNLEDFAGKITVPNDIGFKITDGITREKPTQLLDGVLELVEHNGDQMAEWMFGTAKTNATTEFVKEVAGMMRKMSFISEVLGHSDDKGPFIGEMIESPGMLKISVSQSGGTITSKGETKPPVAEFDVTPAAGIVGTVFSFDASESFDEVYPLAQLQFRWDFTSSDYFTGWSTSPGANYTYSEGGAYSVVLEVKNPANLVSRVSHRVNVGGGAGTANHVKVFKNGDPWSSDALIEVLQGLGFVEGVGANTYETFTSSEMSTATLIAGEDLVIIVNDQDQTFYNDYAANQAKFASFVNMGGSMFWEACDQGWAGGSIADAGITMPGNVEIYFAFDNYNYVVDPNLPLTAGLPNEMDHNYASHEYFDNLVEGTTIYLQNSEYQPTLIEFNLGAGWVIMSTQPLEHQYDRVYGNEDMEELLPRIVAYFTGKTWGEALPLNKNTVPSTRASSLR